MESKQSLEWQVQMYRHLFDKTLVLIASFSGRNEIMMERIPSGSSISWSSSSYKNSKTCSCYKSKVYIICPCLQFLPLGYPSLLVPFSVSSVFTKSQTWMEKKGEKEPTVYSHLNPKAKRSLKEFILLLKVFEVQLHCNFIYKQHIESMKQDIYCQCRALYTVMKPNNIILKFE